MLQEMITLKLRESGEYEFQVPRDEYEAAKADDELDDYLDAKACRISTNITVVEPDGTEFDLY